MTTSNSTIMIDDADDNSPNTPELHVIPKVSNIFDLNIFIIRDTFFQMYLG